MGVFHYRGSLPPDSPLFVGREQAIEILVKCCQPPVRNYVIVFGSRQSGKTSLLYRLGRLLPKHIAFDVIDLAPVAGNDTGRVYQYLAEEIRDGLQSIDGPDPHIAIDGPGLRSFLRKLRPQKFAVIALDELGGISSQVAGDLANLLRSIHQDRFKVRNAAFRSYLFILAGGIELYEPVSLSPVSPLYNISEKIYLEDLSRKESDCLLTYGFDAIGIPPAQVSTLCDQIFSLAQGHPYLTQRLGSMIEDAFAREGKRLQAIPLDDLAQQLIVSDEIHLRPMLKLVEREGLKETLETVLSGSEVIPFSRGLSNVVRLELIGLIRNENGRCVIRNRIYEQAVSVHEQLRTGKQDEGYQRPANEDSAVRRLIEQTEKGTDSERIEAGRALRSLGATEAIPALIGMMSHPEMKVRNEGRSALIKLGQVRRVEVVEALRRVLLDKTRHRYIRRRAVDILGDLHAREAMPELLATASDPDAQVRWRLASTLGKIGDRVALPVLRELLRDPVEKVRRYARNAIDWMSNGESSPKRRIFRDFELLISDRRRQAYPLRVIESPAGEAEGLFKMPWKRDDLEQALMDMEEWETDETVLVDFGTRLFDALFTGDVRARYAESVGLAADDAGLRIHLRLDPPELHELPWELLYDPEKREFLALSKRALITRYLHVPRPTPPLAVTPPLRLLVVTATPRDWRPLSAKQEVQGIEEALQPLVDGGLVQVLVEEHVTKRSLRKRLLDDAPHMLHYIGHGDFDGERGMLILEDSRRLSDSLDGRTLATLLKETSVRLAVLNCCLGAKDAAANARQFAQKRAALLGVGPALVDAGLGAVVAMQFSADDEAAVVFARDLYEMVTHLKPIDEAVGRAREMVMLDSGMGNRNWATPVLFMRAPDGQLFETAKSCFEDLHLMTT